MQVRTCTMSVRASLIDLDYQPYRGVLLINLLRVTTPSHLQFLALKIMVVEDVQSTSPSPPPSTSPSPSPSPSTSTDPSPSLPPSCLEASRRSLFFLCGKIAVYIPGMSLSKRPDVLSPLCCNSSPLLLCRLRCLPLLPFPAESSSWSCWII